MYKHLLTAAIVASTGMSPAQGQGASTGDSSIAHMVSGGAWAAGTRRGVYRLIVSNDKRGRGGVPELTTLRAGLWTIGSHRSFVAD